MGSRAGWIGMFLLVAGVAGILRLKPQAPAIPDLRDLAMITQQAPEDTAEAQLAKIGPQIQTWPLDHDHLDLHATEDLRRFRNEYQTVLDQFWTWYDTGGKQAFAPRRDTPKAARIFLSELERFTEDPPYLWQTRLHRLLLTQAVLAQREERFDQRDRALTASFELAHFYLQNPGLYQYVMGFAMLGRSQFVLAEMLSEDVFDARWVPYLANQEHALTGFRKAMWLEMAQLTHLVDQTFEKDRIRHAHMTDADFEKFFDLGQTRALLGDSFRQFLEDLEKPVESTSFEYPHKAATPFLWSSNQRGREFVAKMRTDFKPFIVRPMFAVARADVLRVRLALQQQHLPWERENVVRVLTEGAFVNPLTQEPYTVTEEGRIEVFPANSPHWLVLHTPDHLFAGMVGPDIGEQGPMLEEAKRQRIAQRQAPPPNAPSP